MVTFPAVLLAAVVVGAAIATTSLPRLSAAPAAQAESSAIRVHLPMAVAETSFDGLHRPPTAIPATATPLPTATNTPTPTNTPPPTATPFVCGDLPERISVSNVGLGGAEIRVPARGSAPWTTFPVIAVPRGDGALVGWSSTDEVIHLTPIDADDQRAGPDWTVPGHEIRGLVAHNDGGVALLVGRPPGMFLLRLDEQGEQLWETQLFGQNGTRSGAKFITDWPRESRLLWDGRQYAAYVGHTENFGGRGTHQGDLLWFFDAEGAKVAGESQEGWDWGCSHSLDLRLAHNGSRLGPVCLSDSFPEKAFMFNHDEKRIKREPTGDGRGFSEARLGGWVPLRREGFLMSFASPTGATGGQRDVGVVKVSNDSTVGAVRWLTQSPNIAENNPHLTSYGRNFLAGWTVDTKTWLAEIDVDGAILEGPSETSTWVQSKDDFITVQGGDALLVVASEPRTELMLQRVQYCQRR